MIIDRKLLKTFRNNLNSLRTAKKELELQLLTLRSEIKEYELAIDYIDRNIKRNVNKANKKKG